MTVRSRAVLILSMLVLSIAAGRTLAAQELDELRRWPLGGAVPPEACDAYRLLGTDSEPACGLRGLRLTGLDDQPADDTSTSTPGPASEKEPPRRLLAALVAATEWSVSLAKATVPYELRSFHVSHEGFFGANTIHGGADKASHFVDYVIISKEFAFIFEKLGYSEASARWMGVGTAITGGLLNEVGDGFASAGFSFEDLLMDTLGAATGALLTATRLDDVVGFRSSLMNDYNHDVYSMDLKLSGLARRLGINIGPLQYLLFSLTYGVKGYANGSTAEPQRQVGLEIGVSLEEILKAAGARRDTWWGWALHVVGDNIRFPYTAVGFRFDLNHHKWHGPNTGNFP
jgi:Predicted periplasmic lipoprotein (DUF2279)